MDTKPSIRPDPRKLFEGAIVHFVLPENKLASGYSETVDRPLAAMVTRIWDHEQGIVNLTVFPDGLNDIPKQSGLTENTLLGRYESDVPYSAEETVERSWHFPQTV